MASDKQRSFKPMPTFSCDIALRCAKKDIQAWQEVYEKAYEPMVAYAEQRLKWYNSTPANAADIVQVLLVKLMYEEPDLWPEYLKERTQKQTQNQEKNPLPPGKIFRSYLLKSISRPPRKNPSAKPPLCIDDLDDQSLLVAPDTDYSFECMLESSRHLLEELSAELQNTWRLWLEGPRGQRIADILSEEILKDSNKQYNIYLLRYLLLALSTFNEKLKPKYRLPWKLWLHGEDAGEISKKLNIPIETVRTRLKRTEETLETHIQALPTT